MADPESENVRRRRHNHWSVKLTFDDFDVVWWGKGVYNDIIHKRKYPLRHIMRLLKDHLKLLSLTTG